MSGNSFALIFAGIDDAPDSALLPIQIRRAAVLIARVLVIPVGDPQIPIRPRLRAHRPKPPITAVQKPIIYVIFALVQVFCDEALAIRYQWIAIDTMTRDIAHEGVAVVFSRILPA